MNEPSTSLGTHKNKKFSHRKIQDLSLTCQLLNAKSIPAKVLALAEDNPEALLDLEGFLSPSKGEEDSLPFRAQLEEAQILWKLNRHSDAVSKGEALLEENPEDLELLEFMLSVYLDRGNTTKANSIINDFSELGGDASSFREMQLYLHVQDHQWEKVD